METYRLRDADPTLRMFITVFLIVLTAGYAVGLAFVDHTTSATPSGIESRFLGTDESGEPAGDMTFPKSSAEMFTLIHNHVFGLSILFFVLGGIFYFSSLVRPGLKRFLMVEPLAGIATTFGGLALVRYVSPAFSWLVVLSGISVGVCYAAMILLILSELWLPSSRRSSPSGASGAGGAGDRDTRILAGESRSSSESRPSPSPRLP